MPTCSISGCDRPVVGWDMCSPHYQRWEKYGDPLAHIPIRARKAPVAERFWPHVDTTGGPAACWPWTGSRNAYGYGSFATGKKSMLAHRQAYELVQGPIPQGMVLDHVCHTASCTVPARQCPHRACCNPAHLAVVSPLDNNKRRNNPKRVSVCKKGHPLNATNTYVHRKTGYRACRLCRLRHTRAFYRRRQARDGAIQI